MLGATQLLLGMLGLAVAFYVPLGTDCGTIAHGSFAAIQVGGRLRSLGWCDGSEVTADLSTRISPVMMSDTSLCVRTCNCFALEVDGKR